MERLQDVPVPVSVLNAGRLVSTNQLQLQDYYTKIPGLSAVTTAPYGGANLSIRGLSAGVGAGATSVGIVVDDVPYSGAGQGLSVVTPELDPTDIAQIEVLRGPQGTLYGANSLGGLIKYVTIPPSTDRFSAHLRTGAVSVKNGDEIGYNVGGDVNVPLGDAFAVRASAFTRHEPGYIDDPVHGLEGVNSRESSGGRLAALWAPSEAVSLTLTAMRQKYQADGSSDIILTSGFGDLQQAGLPGAGGFRREVDIYTAQLSANLGAGELTVLSGYTDLAATFDLDLAPSGPAGLTAPQSLFMTKNTQEARFAFPIGDRTDALLGVYYASDKKRVPQTIFFNDYATGARTGQLQSTLAKLSFEEGAAFANVTFRLTDRFDVQIGGRAGEFETNQTFDVTPFATGVTAFGPLSRAKDESVTYLLTPRFKLNPDFMVYARLASGYRSGGGNTNAPLNPLVPLSFDADETRNYEVGVKGAVLEGALTFDASIYYIDWEDVQVTLLAPAIGTSLAQRFVDNAGKANSQGVELSVESRPMAGLAVTGWVAYNEAELTEDFPANAIGAVGADGERLPLGARWSGNVSVDYESNLTGTVEGYLGGSLSYVGARNGNFRTSAIATRARFPSYSQADLRAGVKFNAWDVGAFVTNVTDKRGILYDSIIAANARFQTIQPRTFGVSVSKSF